MNANVRKYIMVFTVVGLGVCFMLLGSSMAYFSNKTEVVINNFTVGEISIDVIEDDFDKEEAKTVEPGQVINKNPSIKNVGKNDAYVFIEVSIPRKSIKVVNDDETVNPKEIVDLFTYDMNADWIELSRESDDNTTIIAYAYLLPPLNVGQTTTTLFDKVKFVNFLEGSLDKNETYILDVKGYAVQYDGVDTSAYDTDFDKYTYIYKTFLN